MSYATGHNSFMGQYLLNIHIYCRFCRFCIINVSKVIVVMSYANVFSFLCTSRTNFHVIEPYFPWWYLYSYSINY
jgi:hypothetical protein